MKAYISIKQLLEREDRFCNQIQTAINFLAVFEEEEANGRDMSAHAAFKKRLEDQIAELLPQLRRVRAEIGGKVMMVEEIAAATLRERLRECGADGDDE